MPWPGRDSNPTDRQSLPALPTWPRPLPSPARIHILVLVTGLPVSAPGSLSPLLVGGASGIHLRYSPGYADARPHLEYRRASGRFGYPESSISPIGGPRVPDCVAAPHQSCPFRLGCEAESWSAASSTSATAPFKLVAPCCRWPVLLLRRPRSVFTGRAVSSMVAPRLCWSHHVAAGRADSSPVAVWS